MTRAARGGPPGCPRAENPYWAVLLIVSLAATAAMLPESLAAPPPESLSVLEERAIQKAAAEVAPSTVRIEPASSAATGGSDNDAATTGLVIAAPGWVITSSFGLSEAAREVVVVSSDGRRRAGRIRGRDASRRLVLMEVEPPDGLAVPRLAADATTSVGSWAIALGRGWSATRTGISAGIVSADGRVWGRAIQTDAAVSPANYGGPLVDIRGRVIGILSPLPADTAGMPLGSELYDSGIGFAVPIGDVLDVLPRLQAGETLRPGILGISYASPDPFTSKAIVASSRTGSPASIAGIRPGDRIVSANAMPVDTVASLRQILGPLYAGDRVRLEVQRSMDGGQPKSVPLEATLVDVLPPYRRAALGICLRRPVAARPPADVKRAAADAPGESPKEDAGRPGSETPTAEQPATPPVVRWLWPDSPAARAGLRSGDAILSIAAIAPNAADPPATGPGAAAEGVGRAALLRGIVSSEEIGTRFRVTVRRGEESLSFDVPSAPLPTGVPPSIATGESGRDANGRPVATIERLEAADVENPALVVLPPGSATEAVGVVVVLGDAKAAVDERTAEPWLVPAAEQGVAIVLLRSADGSEWGKADVRATATSLEILAARRAVDASRVAVAGLGPGAEAAWTIGESLAAVTRGIAVLEGHLPRRAAIPEADPARPLSVLLSDFGPDRGDVEAGRRAAADRKRLSDGAIPWGTLETRRNTWPTESICRWVESLGLL